MRCVHCGNSISAFKKLTDSNFCSAEHRDRFQAEQQRLILDRLRHSAEQLQRLRRVSPPERPRIAPTEPPAIHSFFSTSPEIRNRPEVLFALPPIFPEIPTPAIPARSIGGKSTSPFLSKLIPDFPWPKYNSGFRQPATYPPLDSATFMNCMYPMRFGLPAQDQASLSPNPTEQFSVTQPDPVLAMHPETAG